MTKKQTVLITGATSGIGFEFAKIFQSEGYNLVLASRNLEKLNKVKNELNNGLVEIHIIQSDLSKQNAGKTLFNDCSNNGFDINVLINNAGVGMFGEHVLLSDIEVEKMLMLNMVNLSTLCQLFGRNMKEKKLGYILNVASIAAYQPIPLFSAYSASKSFVLHFSEGIAKELEDDNVVVSCLSPGQTKTNFFTEAGIKDSEDGFFASKRWMSSEKVAQYGIKLLFHKKISGIPGVSNKLLAFSNRFAPRSLVATLTKKFTEKP